MVSNIPRKCSVEWVCEAEKEGRNDFDEPCFGFVGFEGVVMGDEDSIGNSESGKDGRKCHQLVKRLL